MRAWTLALSMAVLISTAVLLNLFASLGPAAPPITSESLRAEATQPAAVEFVKDHPATATRLMRLVDRSLPVVDAAQGFTDPVMFAAVVHASDNLGVPFRALKARVLAGGTSLLDAIRLMKPDVDAGTEANRAYHQARSSVERARNQD